MAVTSQILRPAGALGEVLISDWQGAGLPKASLIKPVLATIEQRLILRKLERFSATMFRRSVQFWGRSSASEACDRARAAGRRCECQHPNGEEMSCSVRADRSGRSSYRAWYREHVVIDTAGRTVEQSVATLRIQWLTETPGMPLGDARMLRDTMD